MLPLPCRASSSHWISPQMICSPYGTAHPHLIHGLRCRSQGQFTGSTSARFRVGYDPIQRVMCFPCLSAAGLGFLEHPTPTKDVAIPCGLGTDCSDLVGVFLFRIGQIQPGWEPAIPRSRGVCAGPFEMHFSRVAQISALAAWPIAGLTRLAQVHARSPVWFLPCPASVCDYLAWGFYLRFTPSDYSKRMGDGQVLYTRSKKGWNFHSTYAALRSHSNATTTQSIG